jgi:hypothetical protein
MRPEIKRLQAQQRRKHLLIIGFAAVATAIVLLLVDGLAG